MKKNNTNTNDNKILTAWEDTHLLLQDGQQTHFIVTNYHSNIFRYAYIIVDAGEHTIEYCFNMDSGELEDLTVSHITFMLALRTFASDIYTCQPNAVLSMYRY